ncbi:MAG TPA: hypothetical protein PKO22_00960 [Treponemataceae bacterium]|nr:hypothetical protein [Treponemataceae bacterium]
MTRTWKIDTLPPSAPTGLKAKCASGGAVSLQWTAFDTANTDVRTYSVHYGVGSQASDATNQWGTPISSAFSTPSGLTVNTRYSFVVNAIDEAGNVSSPGAFVSWFALDDYKNWGTLAPISLQTNSVVDALTTFTKMDGYLVANLAGKGVDLLTLSDPSSIHRVKRILTKPYSDTANKGIAYYGLSSKASPYQIDIVDMSTPKSPIVLGTLPAEEYARFAVSSDGAYLLVALPTTKAVRIYDLSVPTAPTLSATFAINESINVNLLSVSLKDGYLVLDCREQGVHFYEFTSPTSISFVGTADYGASSQGAYIGHKGKYAIFGKTSDSSMTVRDVTNIGTVVKSIAANPSAAFTPRMMGDSLYAEDSSSYMNVSADLYRWDLSALPTINAPTVSVDAVPARVGLGRWSRVSATEYMVWDSGKGIGCLFDVSNPTAPVFGTPFTFSYESSYSYVDATSALFFAIDSYSDLSVIRQDLTDPSASEVTYFKKFSGGVMSGIPPTQQYTAVKAGSTYWLVNGSKLVGVTESAGEFSLASAPASMLSLPNMSAGSGAEIAASGSFLFVRAFNAIHVVDVSTPSAPSRTATIAGPFSNSTAFQHGCFVAADGKLYVSSGFKLVVYDVSAPSAPVVLGSLDYAANGYPEDSNYTYCQDMVIQGGKAYIEVGGSSGGCKLLIVSVSVPATPAFLGVSAEYSLGSATTWEADRLRVDGNYCFAYNRDMKFAVIDAQDPAAPNVLSARSLGSGSGNGYETMYVSGDKFIAADRFMDIQYVSD